MRTRAKENLVQWRPVSVRGNVLLDWEVSSRGDVRCGGEIRRAFPDKKNRARVSIRYFDRWAWRTYGKMSVDRLVLEAFGVIECGAPFFVVFRDGDRMNSALENLLLVPLGECKKEPFELDEIKRGYPRSLRLGIRSTKKPSGRNALCLQNAR